MAVEFWLMCPITEEWLKYMAHVESGILFKHEKETDICNSMNGIRDHYDE